MIAIYSRQSVDKKDSISIEFQIEECRKKINAKEIVNAQYFTDKGFSGKSTNRPQFQSMMEAVREGIVNKVIVYKLDRISRSLIDFLKIEEEFEKRNVSFVSCKEEFDTSSPMGKMMLHILMVFAEMERETIQKRIADNYYARGEKGFYLGGPPPFGYDKETVYVNGKKTYAYKVNPEKAKLVEYAYFQHANNISLKAIARYFNENEILTARGSNWTGETINNLLTNPAYVKANADVYNFFKSLKVTLNNPIEDYVGVNGCLFYGNRGKITGNKYDKYQEQFVTIGLHEGIIDSDLWLRVQFKFKERSGHTNLGDGISSWVQGLVRCECCGTSMYVKNYKSRSKKNPFRTHRYFYCRKKLTSICLASKKMIPVSFLESETEKALISKLIECQNIMLANAEKNNSQINDLKIQLSTVDKKIENLIIGIANATETVTNIINEAIEKLSNERDNINSKLLAVELQERKLDEQFTTSEIIKNWNDFDINIKKKVANNSIKEIIVNGYDIDVVFY